MTTPAPLTDAPADPTPVKLTCPCGFSAQGPSDVVAAAYQKHLHWDTTDERRWYRALFSWPGAVIIAVLALVADEIVIALVQR